MIKIVSKVFDIIEVKDSIQKIYENYNCISRMVSCYFPNVVLLKQFKLNLKKKNHP